jgi:hypothetical protein
LRHMRSLGTHLLRPERRPIAGCAIRLPLEGLEDRSCPTGLRLQLVLTCCSLCAAHERAFQRGAHRAATTRSLLISLYPCRFWLWLLWRERTGQAPYGSARDLAKNWVREAYVVTGVGTPSELRSVPTTAEYFQFRFDDLANQAGLVDIVKGVKLSSS